MSKANSELKALKNHEDRLEELENDLYYQKGDSFINQTAFHVNGNVTSSTKNLLFSIILPKKLKSDITAITVNSMRITVRTVSGQYLNGQSNGISLGTAGITFNAYKSTDNMITIFVTSETAFTNVSNNTPVAITVSGNTKISFS